MKDLTFGTILAVLEEIFGRGLFWLMVVTAGIISVGYIYVLIRDRHISWRKFLWAQVSMPFGAVAAVWFVLAVTDSSIGDMGGPIDLIVFISVAVAGAIGIAVLVYTVKSLLSPPEK
ncbi:MAG: DUF5368 domain-containing protein [Gammaproteobacteria bacterium]|nr:DUF5368 domain-containing protein [Gammaproteobacteria bacterium]